MSPRRSGPVVQFRFSDTNPRTGRPLTQSRFRDLPDYATHVVTDRLRLTPQAWDLFTRDGQTHPRVPDGDVFVAYQISATGGGTGRAAGWGSRQFARPGLEVLDSTDPEVSPWF